MGDKNIEAERLLDLALGEFNRHGKVETVRCPPCGGLILIAETGLTASAWEINCPCGKFRSTLRGL